MKRTELQPILVLEDRDEDFATLTEVLLERRAPNPVHRSRDGEALIEILRALPPIRPAFILLDLDTPLGDGREALARIKSDPATRAIPLIVLTASSHARDIQDSYARGANAYHVKRARHEEHRGLLEALVDYWVGAVAGLLGKGAR
jgi:CheY-like chemotaxis protein